MAEIAVDPALVLPSPNAVIVRGKAGGPIGIGQTVYLDPATSSYGLADANGASPVYKTRGIAVSAAAALGQPMLVCTEDPNFRFGGVAIAGDTLIQSATPGGIAEDADGAPGQFKSTLGIVIDPTHMALSILRSDVVTPEPA